MVLLYLGVVIFKDVEGMEGLYEAFLLLHVASCILSDSQLVQTVAHLEVADKLVNLC